jgi:hypothetical protein
MNIYRHQKLFGSKTGVIIGDLQSKNEMIELYKYKILGKSTTHFKQ